ncbi:uncharacterized protein LOC113235316 [Hyposmocoma kahamanoa]|uniref:uncharacterized protein LOC113235316 n=1 Tax=Hyposmocoma kahamanoa TaxID=1477025 RepID=UPI000E6D8971|nr:uncharacterized protein LOC113235316 [Hyposmocoma kahamanoa]
MIFGVTGACRRQELSEVTAKDVETHGQMLLIKINNTKNKVPRSFAIHGPFYDIVKKYEALRTDKAKSDRFFQNYQKGRCVAQPTGINKFGAMPKEIAKFLNLPDPDLYTGHSFRRTSATLLADSGADLLTLKRHGGWRSSTVAESYVEDSVRNKSNICTQITHAINLEPQVKKMCPEPQPSTSRDTSHVVVSNKAFEWPPAEQERSESSEYRPRSLTEAPAPASLTVWLPLHPYQEMTNQAWAIQNHTNVS